MIQFAHIVELCWSGNKLDDEPTSFLSKIIGAYAQKTRKGMALNAIIVSIALLLVHLIQITAEPNSYTSEAIRPYLNFFTFYVIASLIAMSSILLKRPFITPEVKHAQCPVCKNPMATTKLYCENCQKSFG